MLHFFVYLFLTHITRVAWTFFASISFTQCLFFFVYVQLLSSPPLIYKLLFFALFARNILIVAREMGHRVFFFLGPAVCVGKEGKYLGRRDCDSLGAPLLSL